MVLISVNSRMGVVRVLYPILSIGGEPIIKSFSLPFSSLKIAPCAPLEEKPSIRAKQSQLIRRHTTDVTTETIETIEIIARNDVTEPRGNARNVPARTG